LLHLALLPHPELLYCAIVTIPGASLANYDHADEAMRRNGLAAFDQVVDRAKPDSGLMCVNPNATVVFDQSAACGIDHREAEAPQHVSDHGPPAPAAKSPESVFPGCRSFQFGISNRIPATGVFTGTEELIDERARVRKGFMYKSPGR
jgi:hypothetical protein